MSRGLDRDSGSLRDRELRRRPLLRERELRQQVERLPQQRELYRDRDRHYELRRSEVAALRELATFRVIPGKDMQAFQYGNDRNRMQQDFRNLAEQKLIKSQIVYPRRGRENRPVQVFSITRDAARLLDRVVPMDRPYAHVVKQRELLHDAGVYRMYQAKLGDILGQGGRDPRPVLDHDLKRSINARLAQIGRKDSRQKEEIAEAYGLPIMNHRMVLPDLRIEYEDRYGDPRSIDLELVTQHYRARHIAQKSQAGFTLYSADGGKAHSRHPEILYEVFSL